MSHTTLEPLFDREAALGRLGGDLELLKELAELYKQEYPRVFARLRAAVACKDPVAVRSVAHELKGVVSNFEAKSAFAMATEEPCLRR
jgi:HPt (histidine-containing phosphotransfer) domain-containing protein